MHNDHYVFAWQCVQCKTNDFALFMAPSDKGGICQGSSRVHSVVCEVFFLIERLAFMRKCSKSSGNFEGKFER